MALHVDVLFDQDLTSPENRPAQAVQLLGEILPYVYAKYRLAQENRLQTSGQWPRTDPPSPRPR